jgi:hypothetical protein
MRILMKFDTTSLPNNADRAKKVKQATLKMYRDGGSGSRSYHWRIFPVLEPWDEATVTHNTYPAVNRSVILENYQTYIRSGWQSSEDYTRYQWGYGNTAMMDFYVQRWVDDPASNYGLSIESIQTRTGWDSIRTKEYSSAKAVAGGLYTPRLEIQYDYDLSTVSPVGEGCESKPNTDLRNNFGVPGKHPILNVATKEECCEYCTREIGCSGWTWNDFNQCYLKSGTPDFQPTAGVSFSGAKSKVPFYASRRGVYPGEKWAMDTWFRLPLVRKGQVRCGAVPRGAGCGAVRCDMMWCGAVRYDVVRCGAI